MMKRPLGRDGGRLDRLREAITLSEKRIVENLNEIGGKLSIESISLAFAARGSELFAERLKPSINGLGDTMRETFNRVLDSINRDPLSVFMMGAGAGLVLLSLYYNSKPESGGRGENMETAMVGSTVNREEETVESGKNRSGGSLSSMMVGLSVLALGVAMSGIVPGINSEKIDELRADLFSKAVETGEEFIKGAERMLREKFSP